MGFIGWLKGLELWAKILLGVFAVGIVVTGYYNEYRILLYYNNIKI